MNATNTHETHALSRTVMEIDVNNHAGVMSHVVGLFSRRAFNVDSIVVLPQGDGAISRIWLLVNEDDRLDQMTKQLEKLEDVIAVRRQAHGNSVFEHLAQFVQAG